MPRDHMTRDEWLSLAARCQAATGVDRGIDAAMAEALGLPPAGYQFSEDAVIWVRRKGTGPIRWSPPTWTGSLDAITALIERELPSLHWLTGHAGDLRPQKYTGYIMPPSPSGDIIVTAHTPALALASAFCLAMAESEPT